MPRRKTPTTKVSAIDCPVLVTDRLVLRPPHQDDIPELAVLADNRRVAEMLARMPHPYGEAGGARLRAVDPQRNAVRAASMR